MSESVLPIASIQSAQSAGLQYATDDSPGIRRQRAGKGFRYLDAAGRQVRDPRELRRILSLVIPPAWRDVWICPLANGHIQATGRDERGRKQYKYHPRWQEIRDQTKYERMLDFGKTLPRLRRQVHGDLAKPALSQDKVLATIIRLLETTLVRVGNEEYAKQNHSFGLTTLRTRHVKVVGSTLRFQFRGKSGIQHEVDVQDRRLAKIVRDCMDLPGQELFQYLDEEGKRHAIGSTDVNEYLRQISQQDFTAKDFRTWAGTVLAARALRECEPFTSQTQAKRNVVGAVKSVAVRLGNTVAVCRKCYIHPAIIEAYLNNTLPPLPSQQVIEPRRRSRFGLSQDELFVLALLKQLMKSKQTRRIARKLVS
ncbi:MAG: DNA topoisomerase IB [Gemmataceae bacterium]